MDDITYTFNQTNKERKALVPSALKRTNGSRSHRCTLPHENLTPAQRKKLDGPVRKYNLTEPMGWEEFKLMPLDLQEKYLADIAEHFGVGSSRIAMILFRRSDMAIPVHCKRYGISYPVKQGKKTSFEELSAFKAWANGETSWTGGLLTDTSEPEKPVETVEPVSSVESDKPTARTCITQASLRMSGTAEDVLAALRNFLTGDKVEIEITINYKEENK